MVEQEQPIPILTPNGMEEVDRAKFKARLAREHKRVERLNEKAQQLYKKPLSQVQQAAANQTHRVQYGRSAGFNATANTLASSAITQTQKETQTMSTENKKLSPEQQQYISTLSNKKRLYQANSQLQNAMTAALNMRDNPQALKLAQDISAASQTVQATANNLHHQQKEIEEKNPELKTQAIEYSKSRQQTQTQSQSQQQEPKQTQQRTQPQQSF